tara:strand:+ start:1013 stop:1789 length:777 start_codon:yes stop_codon:yes gene_type:complete
MNQKGGTGKTTTAVNLAAYLAILGKRVLLIDFDPQANATMGLGIEHGPDETVYHAMFGSQDHGRVIKPTHFTNLHMVPASADLAGALVELVNVEDRERHLRKFVDSVRDQYDFMFIDLGPSLNLLTINGFLASDEVIIPIQCEYYSLRGVEQLLETVQMVRDNLGHPLQIAGALLTMHEEGKRFSQDVVKDIRENFPHHVYESVVPRSVPLAEAPSFSRPVVLYAPQSSGARAYERLAEELIKQGESANEYQAPKGEE